jgi:hypothetical protein
MKLVDDIEVALNADRGVSDEDMRGLIQAVRDLEEAKARGELGLTASEIYALDDAVSAGPNMIPFETFEKICRIRLRFKDVRSKLPDEAAARRIADNYKTQAEHATKRAEQYQARENAADKRASLAEQNVYEVTEELRRRNAEIKHLRNDLSKLQASAATNFLSTVQPDSDQALSLAVRLIDGKLPKVSPIAGTTALIGAATKGHVGIAYTAGGALRALIRKLVSGPSGVKYDEEADEEEEDAD